MNVTGPLSMRSRATTRIVVASALLVLNLAAAEPPAAMQPVAPSMGSGSPSSALTRRYRASAYISVLSIPIFSRAGVGGGLASIAEEKSAAGERVRLRFVSGSTPERAHGLNRLGFVEEAVLEAPDRTVRSDYFGFMTSSGEESVAQGRAALSAPQGDTLRYVAATGTVTRNQLSYVVQQLSLPASLRWPESARVAGQVHARLTGSSAPQRRQADSNGEAVYTFLYAVKQAIVAPERKTESLVVNNAKLFRLRTEKAPDPKTGSELAHASLIKDPGHAMRLVGSVQNQLSGEVTNFRVWFDRESPNPLPLRFEFRPKSFLRLVFEAEPDPAPRPADKALISDLKH